MLDGIQAADPIAASNADPRFWSETAAAVITRLASSDRGLTSVTAAEHLRQYGPNRLADEGNLSVMRLFLRQFRSPLVLILLFGAGVSFSLREWVNAGIILTIVVGSGLLGFVQEYGATRAVAVLRGRLALKARVLRDGIEVLTPASDVVPGDVVLLSAGNLVPGDGLVLAAEDFLVTEASLTGESFPVEKRPGLVPADAPAAQRTNAVLMGSSVRSGTANALIVLTGRRTAYGEIAGRLRMREPRTQFEEGLARLGSLLVRVMAVTVLLVLTANQLLGRPVADSLLFAVALAVGLSPELLPAIVTVTLSRGARRLAANGVIVRRLEAIENLGGMDVLCADKTGTLTAGAIVLEDAVDEEGYPSAGVGRVAFLNAALETGIANPLDAAIVAWGQKAGLATGTIRKVDEIPYDFLRRRLTIVIDEGTAGTHRMICKGAVAEILAVCTDIRTGNATATLTPERRARLDALFRAKSEAGYRVLAVADRIMPARAAYDRQDEAGLAFVGFLLFLDPPKADAAQTIRDLAALGVAVKIVSGDNRYVTAHLARTVGLDPAAILTGGDLARMGDEALWHAAPRTDIFAEIEPQAKERIVRALKHDGRVVGYLGDGINDAPALHAADVGISVEDAVDVARESADIVLLTRDLGVLRRGIEGGRRDFANTLKYIAITTSANFGNRFDLTTKERTGMFPLPDHGRGGGGCNDMAISPDGTLFVTETNRGGVGRVLALVPDSSGALHFITIVGGSSLGGVDGLAFLGNTLYVNDVFANKLIGSNWTARPLLGSPY